MKIQLIPICCFLLIAQSTLPGQVSPDIHEDGRVTFRIEAPNADSVAVSGQWTEEPLKMTRGKKGLWEGTTPGPVPPGVWEYGMIVDRLRTIDSRNSKIKPQRWLKSSILHIKADPPAHWDLQHIPHGTLHHHDYWSTSLNSWRKLVVYTPPGYRKEENSLPVLYLSHGFSDNERAWSVHGKAHYIMDSLIDKQMARRMLVVMPDGHAIDPEGRDKEIYRTENRQAYSRDLVTDILPFVENHYNVSRSPSLRAFAGLSMGGGHAFTAAFHHHDKFSHIGGFSSSPLDEESIRRHGNATQMNKDLKLFWIACGDKDFLFDENQIAHSTMKELGIRHEYVITPGDRHSWPVWRRYLIEFLPKLF